MSPLSDHSKIPLCTFHYISTQMLCLFFYLTSPNQTRPPSPQSCLLISFHGPIPQRYSREVILHSSLFSISNFSPIANFTFSFPENLYFVIYSLSPQPNLDSYLFSGLMKLHHSFTKLRAVY